MGYAHKAPHTSGAANPKMDHEHGKIDPTAGLGVGSPQPGQENKQGALRGTAGNKKSSGSQS